MLRRGSAVRKRRVKEIFDFLIEGAEAGATQIEDVDENRRIRQRFREWS
jgi:hypothetical protein